MTIADLPGRLAQPHLGTGGTQQAPPDEPPSVRIAPIPGPVVAGVPVSVTVTADPGVHWVRSQEGSFEDHPKVEYTGTTVSIDGVAVATGPDGGGIFTVTFARPGDHSVKAVCPTTTGHVDARPVGVRVAAAGPPAFTVTSPADGALVDLGEGGGSVEVRLTIPADQFFPLTVTLARDGQTTTEVATGPQFTKTVALAPMPLGPRPIEIRLADRDGLTSTRTRTVTGRDVAPPHVQVEFPQPAANIVGDATGSVTVPVHGTATDSQSGMSGGAAAVAWALSPGGARTPARPLTGVDLSNWTADVPLSGFGAHTIHVWATDRAGNVSPAPVAVPVVVISSYTPATLQERLDEREYLAALLSFAQEQVTVPGPPPGPLDTHTLVGVLGQPVDRLSQPLSAEADRGGREVNQLRVPIELLRARIAATHTSPAPGGTEESRYRGAAYDSLLAATGTSYAELRLARGAPPAVREALAARLGIRLSATAPDELDQLVLDGARLTEAALERVFGLPSTADPDPLRALAIPMLLSWQLSALALRWAEEDQHPSPPRAYDVLVDPDVVGPADVAAGPNNAAVGQLLAQRGRLLSDFAVLLDDTRTAAGSPAQGLAAMQAQALPGVDLADLAARDGQGTDIAADLAAVGLPRAAFLYLRKLGQLAAAGDLTAAEWADAVAILTRCHKHSLLSGWAAQETAFLLSPDYFVLAGDGPAVNPFRVDPRARADWQDVLRTRTTQRQDLVEASARAVAATEQTALPILRDALLADLAPATPGDVGEAMSALFLVDVLAGGTLRTTRIRQAIESVQSLLSAKRTGELTQSHPAFGWSLIDFEEFTAAWSWMGELGTWQSATTAFLFPERHLDPALLVTGAGTHLDEFFDGIRGTGPFSRAQADQAAAAYLTAVGLGTVRYLDPARSPAHQAALRDLSKQKPDPVAREIFWAVPMLLAQRLQTAGDYQAALDWYWIVYPYDVGSPVSGYDRINTETPFRPDLTFPPRWTAELDPFELVADRPTPYSRYTLLAIIRCHLDFADAEFSRETDESVATARTLYLTARRLLGSAALVPQQPTNPGEPALEIPDLTPLRARADVQLAKLRQGRNIAGLARTQPVTAAVTVSQPTPYRFRTLLDRARQLAAQAGQLEAGYLAALEKYDDRSLRLFDAMKSIDLTSAQVALAGSRVTQAVDAVAAANAQKAKADTMAAKYQELIDAPPNQYETDLLSEYGQLRDIKDHIVTTDAAIGIAQAASNAASSLDALFSLGMKQVLAAAVSVGLGVKADFAYQQDSLEAQMQANQLKAGIEQRKTEWSLQQTAAAQESLVAAAQVTVATDQVSIAVQEQAIATLQHDQATATLRFLNGQFTNADLYLWLSTTLGGVYRYFLQQATATARLAQDQLAFERAEPAQTVIRTDYWQSPGETSSSGPRVDRRGLTGAEQLGQDLARLEDYALRSERRRLNLSQTFSLARLMPVEFLEFRRTGTLAFATPMALFDADFPGHYLRMVRQVRASLVALVPPDRGIRATLYSNGISRVVTGRDGAFGDVLLRRDPTVVALTSPVNASGVFELDVQSDMLLPFESSGVDTTWEFQLPPAANPFDFSAIVDLLLTVDYTALQDDGYRSQVAARLNRDRTRGADCAFSLARDFPDQWYDLNNPADPQARSVTIPLRDVDFPLGIDQLTTAAVAVRLVSRLPVPPTVLSLHRGSAEAVGDGPGGEATTTDGIASTRRGNAASWTGLSGSSPVGGWTVGFGPEAAALFESGQLDDILLTVGWSGQAPLWTT